MNSRTRPRRLRTNPAIRRAVAETRLTPGDLIAPLVVKEDIAEPIAIDPIPGQFQHTVDSLVKEARVLANDGVAGLLLFGIPSHKDGHGSQADHDNGITQVALARLRDEIGGDMLIASDVCLCEYTSHGQCTILSGAGIDEHRTLERYRAIARSHARAGAHFVAPSGMMDGQVAAIRDTLDGTGYSDVGIIGYSAKYASSFYAPFRNAAEGAPSFGDRRHHQMDPANLDEALREIELDLEEGADVVMVKPATTYLDVVHAAKTTFRAPVAAYHVSGEYSMLHAAAERGWIDYTAALIETLTSIKRAGADLIVTYAAKEIARWLS
ncbi:MAG: porphobilinogen synthase [Actinomycetota bacterium]